MSDEPDPGQPPGVTNDLPGEGSTAADRVRALADGHLDGAVAARVRAEIAADPALRAFYEEWLLVAGLTASIDTVPECTATAPAAPVPPVASPAISAAARETRRTSSAPRRRFAPWISVAAAALLAAVAWGVATRDSGPVAIVAPELRGLLASAAPVVSTEPDEPDAALLARLASFEPSADGGIAWIDDWDAANALARASGKPLLVYVHVEGCPYCAEFDRHVWPDATVRAAAEQFVPARVDALRAPERFADVFDVDRWPYVAVIDGDGEMIHEFGGRRKAADMRTQIGRGAAKATERRAGRPSWEAVRRASKAVLRGDDARAAGRFGEALLAYRDGASAGAGVGTTDTAADSTPARISASRERIVQGVARETLSKIVETARTDAARAASAADDAAQRFSGSAVGAEFGALARTLRETGRVPSFEEAQR